MKKLLSFLLAVVLLASVASSAQAQTNKNISTAEASALLQKFAGDWQVDFSLWQPQNKVFLKSQGNATISKQQPNYVREQFTITRPDGSTEEGEGILCYSEANKRFEFVQIDNSGKSAILLTGQWFPENKTLVLNAEKGMELWGSKNGALMQLQFIFFEDGTFMKSYRTSDSRGNYSLLSQYHYKVKHVNGLGV